MNKIYIFFITIFLFKTAFSKNIWIGEWVALDKWQSEFSIIVHKDGNAISNYGDGDEGKWSLVDGNLEIRWESGKSDYFFNGVMGYQRISRFRENSYTSGLKKLHN